MDADIYVLANNRSAEEVLKVLDKYLPFRIYQMESEEGKYEFWDDAKDVGDQTSIFFDSEIELFNFLENQSGIFFRPSFRSTMDSEIRVVCLYYFEDDSLVIGINIKQDEVKELQILGDLKELLGSIYGYISYHVPPEHGRIAFIDRSEFV